MFGTKKRETEGVGERGGYYTHERKQTNTHLCVGITDTHRGNYVHVRVCVCVCVYTSVQVLDWVLQTANYLTKERQEKGALYTGKAVATGLSIDEQLRPATTGRPFHLPGFPKVGQTTEACKQHGEPIVF